MLKYLIAEICLNNKLVPLYSLLLNIMNELMLFIPDHRSDPCLLMASGVSHFKMRQPLMFFQVTQALSKNEVMAFMEE